MIKKLMSYLDKYKLYTILTPIAVIGEVILEIFIPFIMSKIIDVGIANKDIPYITKTGLLMILMALISLLFGALAGRFASVAATGLSKNIRGALFDKIQDFSFSNVDKFSTASLVTRLTTDVTNTQNAFMMTIRILVRAPIMLICALIMALNINAKLSLIFIVAIPFLGIALYIIATTAFKPFQIMLKKYDKMNAIIQENLIAIRAVKAFVRGDHEFDKFHEAAKSVRDTQRKAEGIIIFNMPVMMFAVYGCMISISWFGGNMIINGNMTTGELMSFISYVTQILMSLMMISMVFVNIVLSRASVTRIIEVLDEESDIKNPKNPITTIADGSIVFDHVNFRYNNDSDNNALDDINLTIKSGETIGIIGGTGSSKSSLVQLIPRLYDVTDGKVLVGGRDVRDYDIESLRNAVAMVLQKNVLFSGTIAENLRWGNENATNEELEEACKCACAYDFVESFPDKYDTDLGQGGVNVSGGQKQRLCIARALLKKPKIIILDDSTSAVDTTTDSNIRAALKKNLSETTTIIIAQRITSVCDADKIIIMDDGKISAIGTHDELLKNNDVYKEIYNSQQKGADDNA